MNTARLEHFLISVLVFLAFATLLRLPIVAHPFAVIHAFVWALS